MEFQAQGLCFTSLVRNYSGPHYLMLNWDVTAQKSFPKLSVASWFQPFCPSALLFCLLDLRGASCLLGVMSRSLLPPPWVVQMIHPGSPEDDSSKQAHPGRWAHPDLFRPRPFWCWCLNLEVLVCWMTAHGAQKISLSAGFWEDWRAREGGRGSCSKLGIAVGGWKAVAEQPKNLSPDSPWPSLKPPQRLSLQLWCCFCQAPMENEAGEATLILRRFLDVQLEIAKWVFSIERLPDPHQEGSSTSQRFIFVLWGSHF